MSKVLRKYGQQVIIADMYNDEIDGRCIAYDCKKNEVFISEHFCNNLMNGMVYKGYKENKKHGELLLVEDNNQYGPSLAFEYEEYTEFKNLDEDGNGYIITVDYKTGGYIIVEIIANQSILRGIQYIDGNLNHVMIDGAGHIVQASRLAYLGEDYKFTTCRMFSMDFDPDRCYKVSEGRDGFGSYETIHQTLTPTNTKPWGYGYTEWSDDSFYMGEYYEGYRTGIGFQQFENGDRYMGKYYENNISGNGMYINADCILFGNWKQGKKQGLMFEVYANLVLISRYDRDNLVGKQYQFSMDEINIGEIY